MRKGLLRMRKGRIRDSLTSQNQVYMKNILRMSDKEMKEMKAQIETEPPPPPIGMPGMPPGQLPPGQEPQQ